MKNRLMRNWLTENNIPFHMHTTVIGECENETWELPPNGVEISRTERKKTTIIEYATFNTDLDATAFKLKW